jgi:TRAP transporter 4TM/12TM fusion protein
MVIYQLIISQIVLLSTVQSMTIHLSFAMTIIFLLAIENSSGVYRIINLFFLIFALGSTLYIEIFFDSLEASMGFPSTADAIVGFVLIVVALEACRRIWGPVLSILGVLSIVYFFFGHLLGGPLHHQYMPPSHVISFLSVGLYGGVFSAFLEISTFVIFIFVLFGSLHSTLGENNFFLEIGKFLSNKMAGGAGQTAVFASGFLGMITGAAVANVTITGTFTIPLMKSNGYKPEEAGAVEAMASTGGQITPPVLGASAFLMAILLGIPFVEIMKAAIIPAILYYFTAMISVRALAIKSGLISPKVSVNKKTIIIYGPQFIIPLFLLVYLLLNRYSVNNVGFWAIVSLVAISCLRKETFPTIKKLLSGAIQGAQGGAAIAVATATVGILAQCLVTTGLGAKLTMVLSNFSGDNVYIGVFLAMITSVILGCGMPTLAAYSLVAAVVAPVLVSQGILNLAAHFFALYFASVSALTPPVAMAALAAAKIANANYLKTAWESMKLSIALIIPAILFTFNPILLGQCSSFSELVLPFTAVVLCLFAVVAATQAVAIKRISVLERSIYAMSTLFLCIFTVSNNHLYLATGLILFLSILTYEFWIKIHTRSVGCE